MSFFEENSGWLIVGLIVLILLFAFQEEWHGADGFFD